MTRLLIDAYSWIEYLEGSETGEQVLKQIESRANRCYTSSVTVAEVVSKHLRRSKPVQPALEAINALSSIVDVTSRIAVESGRIHAEQRNKVTDFGMIDAVVLATAREKKAWVLTGDPHFKHIKEAKLLDR